MNRAQARRRGALATVTAMEWIGFGPSRVTRGVATAFALAALGAADAAHAIAGVCPDGSVYIVQNASQIPCEGAKQVEPSKIPPLRPENLPRPYLWEVYREKADVSRNPYHLIERADEVRRGEPATEAQRAANRPGAAAVPGPPTPGASERVDRVRDLGLSEGEVRDLFMLVELSQQRAPVHFVETTQGREQLRVSFAYSLAFVERAQQAGLVPTGARNPVVLFSAVAAQTAPFHPNFTVVQGQLAFQPDPEDDAQLGLLRGRGGVQTPDAVVLGYLVLPDGFDLSRPVDLYWNDRRIENAVLTL